jgi:hypothetical protein
MHGRANGTATGLRPRLFDLHRRIAAPASRRESNPRFFKAQNVLADVLAHNKISLRDVLYINDLHWIFDSAPGTITGCRLIRLPDEANKVRPVA